MKQDDMLTQHEHNKRGATGTHARNKHHDRSHREQSSATQTQPQIGVNRQARTHHSKQARRDTADDRNHRYDSAGTSTD